MYNLFLVIPAKAGILWKNMRFQIKFGMTLKNS